MHHVQFTHNEKSIECERDLRSLRVIYSVLILKDLFIAVHLIAVQQPFDHYDTKIDPS